MGVTLRGTFAIVDLASGKIRRIRNEALEADAAVAGLGHTLDGVGSKRQAKQLETYSRQQRVLGNEVEATSKRANTLTKAWRGNEAQTNRVSRAWRGAASTLRDLRVLLGPAKILLFGSAIGVAAQGISALGGGVVGLLPELSDLAGFSAPAVAGIAGLGSVALAGTLALGGLAKAAGGNKQALKDLTPEARKFLATVQAYKPALKGIREEAQKGLFPKLQAALARGIGQGGPVLSRIARRGGATLGASALDVSRSLTSPESLQNLEQLSAQGDTMVRRLVRSMLNLLGIAENFGVAARPFTDWMSKGLELWTKNRLAVSEFNRDSGKTAAFLERSRAAWERFLSITVHLWSTFRGVGRAARGLGDDLWGSADRAAKRWDRFVNSLEGQERLMRMFDGMADTLHAIFGLVGAVGLALARMGSQPGVARVAAGLTGLVPALEQILNGMANAFGPPAVAVLTDFGKVLTDIGGVSGPFVVMLRLLDKVLQGIDALAVAVPPAGKAIEIALSVFLLSRFLTKLGLLEAGWFGVARGANAAAAAESRAARAGMFGGALGGRFGGTKLGGRIGGSTFGTAFGLARMGSPVQEAGIVAGLGTRAGSAARMLGGTARFGGPALFAGGLAASLLPGRAGRIGGAAATGAGLGMLLGPEGALVGGLAGAAVGAAMSGPRRDRVLEQTNRTLKAGQNAIAGYPVALGRLQAELSLYQSAAKSLADDHSKEAQLELAQLREEISVRERLVQRLKDEDAQRRRAKSVGEGRSIARQLDEAMSYLMGHGRSRSQAFGVTADIGIGRLRNLRGPGRMFLAQSLLGMARNEAQGHPNEKGIAARVRADVLKIAPGAAAITAGDRRFRGTLKELRELMPKFSIAELLRETDSPKMTPTQRAFFKWMIAAGFTKEEAAGAVFTAEHAHRAPKVPLSAGGAKALRGLPSVQFAAGAPAAVDAGKMPELRIRGGRLVLTWVTPPKLGTRRKQGIGGSGLRPNSTPYWQPGYEAPSRNATGGRVAGLSMHDNYEIAPNQFAAGGELVVNRHTERKVNAMLGGRNTLGGLVDGEQRPHYMATGGRLHSGISNVSDIVRGHFPGLVVTSTTSGNHVKGSYHFKGMAVDLAGAGMDAAGAWIGKNLAGRLLEGIHNPTLSVKNGQFVAPSFWGPATWAGHANHIHLAARDKGNAGTAGITAASNAAAPATPAAGAAGTVRAPVGAVGIAATRESLLNAIIGLPVGRSQASVTSAGAGRVPASTGPATSGKATGSNQELGRRMMLSRWPETEWPSLRDLWQGESGWNETATNKASGAYGIPQSMPGSKMASAGGDWRTNPRTQIEWGLGYIGGRYGSPSAAFAEWQKRDPHWYELGGRLPSWAGWHKRGGDFTTDGPTVFGAGEGGRRERVTITPASRRAGAASFQPQVEVNVSITGGDPGEVQRAVKAGVEEALLKVANEMERASVAEEVV